MATKAQLKQRCKELEEQLGYAEIEIANLNMLLKGANESVVQYRDWYKQHSERERFLEKCLKQLRYIMALDTVEQATHRERNEKWRDWANHIAWWLSLDIPSIQVQDMDDIPF